MHPAKESEIGAVVAPPVAGEEHLALFLRYLSDFPLLLKNHGA